ncbi:hypothetical protein [Nitrosomonas sp. PY1]|nr:hypothetical protein [Nitrosomonas sp. PY1]
MARPFHYFVFCVKAIDQPLLHGPRDLCKMSQPYRSGVILTE